MVKTQSTNNDQIKTFICSPGSIYYPSIDAILKIPAPNHINSQNEKFQTTVHNRHFYSRRPGVWKRGTHHLNASIRDINLTVTHKHNTQQS